MSFKQRKVFMNKKTALSFFFCTWLITVNGQRFIERVYLKDSSYYEGYIIEQEPTKFLKIDRIKEKDTVTVQFGNIWKLTKRYVTDTLPALKKTAAATKQTFQKSVFLELLGNGGLYSVNFDMRTERGKKGGWGFRAGIEYLRLSVKDTVNNSAASVFALGIPWGMNYLFGKKNGFFELGFGATYFLLKLNSQSNDLVLDETIGLNSDSIKLNEAIIAGTLNIGYRYVPAKSGIMFRATFTPLFAANSFIPYIGLSIGYKFGKKK